jgi:hypothetical protein
MPRTLQENIWIENFDIHTLNQTLLCSHRQCFWMIVLFWNYALLLALSVLPSVILTLQSWALNHLAMF